MQQYLPFTVLKRKIRIRLLFLFRSVATVLTVYGIETVLKVMAFTHETPVATVLTVYGIETLQQALHHQTRCQLQQYLPFTVLKQNNTTPTWRTNSVATVLTVYGIETFFGLRALSSPLTLQQYLPFTVLKLLQTS